MNLFTKYIVPLALLVLAIFNYVNLNWVEGSLYLFMSVSFALMGLLRAGQIKSNLKVWNTISWVLIIISVALFVFLLRMDAYEI